jgi:PilZ domain
MGRVNEVSLGGCYIEIMSPMRVGTSIGLEFQINGHTIRLRGVVRTSQPNCGMGIEFSEINAEEKDRLGRLIAELGGQPAEIGLHATKDSPQMESPGVRALGEAILCWFGSNDRLVREELLQLIARIKGAEDQ